jgi:parallel beta-helix repeat protein
LLDGDTEVTMRAYVMSMVLLGVPVVGFACIGSSPEPRGASAAPIAGAIAWRGATTTAYASASTTSITLTRPPSTQTGDVLVATLGFGNSSATVLPQLTAPPGWMLVRRVDHGTRDSLAVYWHVAAATDPGSFTWTSNHSVGGDACMQDYAGVDPTNPVDVDAGKDNPKAQTFSTPGVTTTTSGDWIVASYYGHAKSGNPATWSVPAGASQRVDHNNGGSRSASADDFPQASAGPVAPIASTSSNTQDYTITHVLALRPAALAQDAGSDSGSSDAGTTGSTYYVATTGSDTAQGSIGDPFRTINHGASVLRPGDTLYVRGGTYPEALINAIPTGTSWTAPVRVSAYPGEIVVLATPAIAARGIEFSTAVSYIEIDNLVLSGSNAGTSVDGVKITYGSSGAATHVRLRGLEIRDYGENGVLLTEDPSINALTRDNEIAGCSIHGNGTSFGHGIYIESSFNTVVHNVIYGNGEFGVHVYRSSGLNGTDAGNNTVAYNRVYNNGFGLHSNGLPANGWGIGLFVGDANLAFNNVVYGNKGGGVYTDIGATHTSIFNNSVFNNNLVGGNHGIEADTLADVRNNAAYGNNGADLYVSASASGSVQDYNVAGTIGGMSGAHSLANTNPLWVDAAAGDFHLCTVLTTGCTASSPAIDVGVTLTEVPDDFDGVSRPQGNAYDVGAYEAP